MNSKILCDPELVANTCHFNMYKILFTIVLLDKRWLEAIIFVTQSDKTSLIAQKYTHVYNGIYLLFCRCYSNSVSFIELLRIFASYMAKFVLKHCVQRKSY